MDYTVQKVEVKTTLSPTPDAETTVPKVEVKTTLSPTPDEENQQRCFLPSNSLLDDWKTDNYSTDLDYEPSDGEDDEPVNEDESVKDDKSVKDDEHVNDDFTFPNKICEK